MRKITKEQLIEKIELFCPHAISDDATSQYKIEKQIDVDTEILNDIAAWAEIIKNGNTYTINKFLSGVIDDLCGHLLSDQLNQF